MSSFRIVESIYLKREKWFATEIFEKAVQLPSDSENDSSSRAWMGDVERLKQCADDVYYDEFQKVHLTEIVVKGVIDNGFDCRGHI